MAPSEQEVERIRAEANRRLGELRRLLAEAKAAAPSAIAGLLREADEEAKELGAVAQQAAELARPRGGRR